MMRTFGLQCFAVTGALVLAAGVLAPALAQGPKKFGPGSARIAGMRGQVTVQRAGAAQPAPAVVNAPLQAGDRIATGPRSWVIVQIDPAHSLRLESNAEIDMVRVETASYRMQLAKGVVDYSVTGPSTANVAVGTAGVSAAPVREGTYRFAIDRAGGSEIVAWAGAIEVFGPGGSEWVEAGRKMIVRGSPTSPQFRIVNAVSRWRRLALLLANSMQVAADVGAAATSSGRSASKTNSSKPASSSAVSPPKNSPSAVNTDHGAPRAPSTPPPAAVRGGDAKGK